jgi:hypothetical protein
MISIFFFLPETFFVDLVLRNPLDAELNLSNVTIVVKESHSDDASSSKSFLDVEVVEDVTLGPRESRTVRLRIQFSDLLLNLLQRSQLLSNLHVQRR